MKRFFSSLVVIMVAVVVVVGYLQSLEVSAEGRVDGAGMTIAAGSHSLVIQPDGSLWAWGTNWFGQLGNGLVSDWDVPNPNPIWIMGDVVSVSASGNHSMAIRSDGSLWSWGINEFGEIGDGTFSGTGPQDISHLSPTQIMNDVVEVSASAAHGGNAGFTLAIRSDGSLWTWGWQQQSYVSNIFMQPTPTRIMEDVIAISAGSHHALAVQSDGSLWAWGDNRFGQLGDGTTSNHPSPISHYNPLFIMSDVVAVSAGAHHSMAIRSDGSLWTWGANDQGQVGDGTLTRRDGDTWEVIENNERLTPTWIMDDVISISAGHSFSMAIRSDGSLWAWGTNWEGQLGVGAITGDAFILSPTKIMDDVISVSTGLSHTLAIRGDGSLWSWGRNWEGQLGDGTTDVRLSPVRIMDNVMLPGGRSLSTANQEFAAFHGILRSYVERHGLSDTTVDLGPGMISGSGVTYARLIDFDQDGVYELLVAFRIFEAPFLERFATGYRYIAFYDDWVAVYGFVNGRVVNHVEKIFDNNRGNFGWTTLNKDRDGYTLISQGGLWAGGLSDAFFRIANSELTSLIHFDRQSNGFGTIDYRSINGISVSAAEYDAARASLNIVKREYLRELIANPTAINELLAHLSSG